MAMKFSVVSPVRRALGLLQQAIHGLHVGVAALVQHPVDDPFNMRLLRVRANFLNGSSLERVAQDSQRLRP